MQPAWQTRVSHVFFPWLYALGSSTTTYAGLIEGRVMLIPLAICFASVPLAMISHALTLSYHRRTEPLGQNPLVPRTFNQSNTLTSPTWPIDCFNPYSTRLIRTTFENCEFIINEIILRYPNPMEEQTWGYTDFVDIDLRQHDNEKWTHGNCAIFVRNTARYMVDRFRIVDVATAAQRLVEECVKGTKYSLGGTTAVGTIEGNFYVGLGGLTTLERLNGTALTLSDVER